MKKINGGQLLSIIFSLFILLGAEILVDPTRPPDVLYAKAAPGQATSLKLTAIFIYPTSQLAIIGGQAVKVGDHLGEFTVTTITANTVELTGSNNTREVLELVTPIKQEK